jgi:hypothetical protein
VKQTAVTAWLSLVILLVLPACEREAPPKPVGSATNKHFEESSPAMRRDTAEAIAGALKPEADTPHQAEGAVRGAERVSGESR